MRKGSAAALAIAFALATYVAVSVVTLAGQSAQAPIPAGPLRANRPAPIESTPVARVPRSRPAEPRSGAAARAEAPVAVRRVSTTAAPDPAAVARERALIDQYCVTCHNDRAKTANLSLQNLPLANVGTQAEVWEKVVRKLRAGVMPPPAMKRPSLDEYEGLRDWLEAELDRHAEGHVNPGSVVLHRLNRTEYAKAIRDLIDLDIDVSTLLPPDDSARGFDNIAGSLTISPTLLEAYATAAARVARTAVGYWKAPTEATYLPPGDTSQNMHIEGLPLGTRGGLMVRHDFPADGEYKLSLQNFGIGSFIPGEQLEIAIDGERAHLFKYQGVGMSQGMQADNDGTLQVTIPVKAGSRTVGATFLQTNFRPSLDMIRQYDRKSLENNSIPQLEYYPAVGFLRIQGPFNPQRPEDSRSRRKVLMCSPIARTDVGSRQSASNPTASEAGCAKQILTTLARRAYRRPATAQDVATLMAFYEDGRRGGAFDDGIELALRRLLASPQFLVRGEREPFNIPAGQPYRITDLELASRLSFFLWSSIPDDELITIASQGRLSNPRVLDQQVKRMLEDPRSEALISNFGQQFLYLRNLPATSPDGVYYPDWDDELRQGYKREAELFFNSIIREDRNVLDLLTADYTFVNERLARQYGIPNVYGSHFRRVTLPPELDYRRGLLGKGSFLSITWTQNFRTSPVKRGVWVLENILGTPPPEPPPNVPPLEDSNDKSGKILTLREQMTMHRRAPTCAGCHMIMDPIGFALDNFDADGKWRTKQGGDGGTPIDASVQLYDGQQVNGPAGLRQALLRYSPQFVQMFVEKMMTYATGRGMEYSDMPTIRAIAHDAAKVDNRFSAIVMGVVKSPQFQMRVKSEANATSTN
jgi:mono/diheme cytochrome c family protein